MKAVLIRRLETTTDTIILVRVIYRKQTLYIAQGYYLEAKAIKIEKGFELDHGIMSEILLESGGRFSQKKLEGYAMANESGPHYETVVNSLLAKQGLVLK